MYKLVYLLFSLLSFFLKKCAVVRDFRGFYLLARISDHLQLPSLVGQIQGVLPGFHC